MRTDERARFMDEIIAGVQVIKLYAWEKPFAKLIALSRRHEMQTILKSGYVRACFSTFSYFTPKIALFSTLLSYVLLYGTEDMSVSKIFMTTYLFNTISFFMCSFYGQAISDIGEMYMAIKRLQIFLEHDERCEIIERSSELSMPQDIAISMKCVFAEWSATDNRNDSTNSTSKGASDKKQKTKTPDTLERKPFRLKEINFEAPTGKLIYVIGSIGAGKSSLLHVLLKELPLISGSMIINGSISYASQESWMFTSTIRQNILFDQPMDRLRYDEVIKSTALDHDFTQFGNGDLTLIGDHGAGLSGGQKARIK